MVNILSSAGYTVSVTTTQLLCCGTKAVTNNTLKNEYCCVQIKLYIQKQVTGQIWPKDCNQPNPWLNMTDFVKSLNSQGDSERLSQELCHQQVAKLDSTPCQNNSKGPTLYHEVILSTSSFQDHAKPGNTRMNKIQTSPSKVHNLRTFLAPIPVCPDVIKQVAGTLTPTAQTRITCTQFLYKWALSSIHGECQKVSSLGAF